MGNGTELWALVHVFGPRHSTSTKLNSAYASIIPFAVPLTMGGHWSLW